MNTFRTFTAALLTLIIIGLLPPTQTVAAEPVAAPATTAPLATAPTIPAPAQLTLVNATAEQVAAVDEVLALFDAANLELAPLQIEFFETEAGCKGHSGLYLPESSRPEVNVDRILMCNPMKIILLHELAHAWKQHNLDDETKDAFTAHWGLSSWNDKTDAHLDRAIERAAHTIAFTLNQTEPTDSESILRYICGYELLTNSTTEIHTKVEC